MLGDILYVLFQSGHLSEDHDVSRRVLHLRLAVLRASGPAQPVHSAQVTIELVPLLVTLKRPVG